MIRVYRDNKSSESYIESVTSGYSGNYLAWDSGTSKISIRNKNNNVEEVNKIEYSQILDKQGNQIGDKQETLDYLNNEVFIEVVEVTESLSDIEKEDYYYYGYEYDDLSYVIIRSKKDNVSNTQKANNISSLISDWNNRETLVYN